MEMEIATGPAQVLGALYPIPIPIRRRLLIKKFSVDI